MNTEAARQVDFTPIRYGQVWEDADILVEGLAIAPGDVCLSVASAGDNALALLGAGAARVIAVDLNPAQLACLALRVAGYRELTHAELLELIGSRPSGRRAALYQRCRRALDAPVRAFWDARPEIIAAGIGGAGKFERYFAFFRRHVLPCVHRRATVERLLQERARGPRRRFYADEWNTWRWRLLSRMFFSRFALGRLGRDPACFKYVRGPVARRILARTCHALTELAPAANPYLHWILTGTHGDALPWALRPENFAGIRDRLDRLEWHSLSVEDFLERERGLVITKFNLSDIFEYMSAENYHRALAQVVAASRPGGRLAYWNMLAARQRPPALAGRLRPLRREAATLHALDKTWFYSAFVLEEVT